MGDSNGLVNCPFMQQKTPFSYCLGKSHGGMSKKLRPLVSFSSFSVPFSKVVVRDGGGAGGFFFGRVCRLGVFFCFVFFFRFLVCFFFFFVGFFFGFCAGPRHHPIVAGHLLHRKWLLAAVFPFGENFFFPVLPNTRRVFQPSSSDPTNHRPLTALSPPKASLPFLSLYPLVWTSRLLCQTRPPSVRQGKLPRRGLPKPGATVLRISPSLPLFNRVCFPFPFVDPIGAVVTIARVFFPMPLLGRKPPPPSTPVFFPGSKFSASTGRLDVKKFRTPPQGRSCFFFHALASFEPSSSFLIRPGVLLSGRCRDGSGARLNHL